MANLEERIRSIVKEELGQDAPGGKVDARLTELEQETADLRKDFQQLMEAEGEQRPGGQ